LIWVV
jgi:hypothetical protein